MCGAQSLRCPIGRSGDLDEEWKEKRPRSRSSQWCYRRLAFRSAAHRLPNPARMPARCSAPGQWRKVCPTMDTGQDQRCPWPRQQIFAGPLKAALYRHSPASGNSVMRRKAGPLTCPVMFLRWQQESCPVLCSCHGHPQPFDLRMIAMLAGLERKGCPVSADPLMGSSAPHSPMTRSRQTQNITSDVRQTWSTITSLYSSMQAQFIDILSAFRLPPGISRIGMRTEVHRLPTSPAGSFWSRTGERHI